MYRSGNVATHGVPVVFFKNISSVFCIFYAVSFFSFHFELMLEDKNVIPSSTMEKNFQSESRSIHYNWMWFQTCHDRLIDIPTNQSAAERFSQQKRCCKQSKGIFLSRCSLLIIISPYIYLLYIFF